MDRWIDKLMDIDWWLQIHNIRRIQQIVKMRLKRYQGCNSKGILVMAKCLNLYRNDHGCTYWTFNSIKMSSYISSTILRLVSLFDLLKVSLETLFYKIINIQSFIYYLLYNEWSCGIGGWAKDIERVGWGNDWCHNFYTRTSFLILEKIVISQFCG